MYAETECIWKGRKRADFDVFFYFSSIFPFENLPFVRPYNIDTILL